MLPIGMRLGQVPRACQAMCHWNCKLWATGFEQIKSNVYKLSRACCRRCCCRRNSMQPTCFLCSPALIVLIQQDMATLRRHPKPAGRTLTFLEHSNEHSLMCHVPSILMSMVPHWQSCALATTSMIDACNHHLCMRADAASYALCSSSHSM
jgi:hypothetical protein